MTREFALVLRRLSALGPVCKLTSERMVPITSFLEEACQAWSRLSWPSKVLQGLVLRYARIMLGMCLPGSTEGEERNFFVALRTGLPGTPSIHGEVDQCPFHLALFLVFAACSTYRAIAPESCIAIGCYWSLVASYAPFGYVLMLAHAFGESMAA
eukprot:2026724-Amphidinium_carterae.1